MTFTWSHTSADTTHFQLETATSQFSPSTTSTLPPVGRNQRFFTVDKSKRSVTLTASQLTESGAPGGVQPADPPALSPHSASVARTPRQLILARSPRN